MKKFLIATTALVAMSAAAAAADLPARVAAPAPVFAAPASWTGFYVGATAGTIMTKSDFLDGDEYVGYNGLKASNFGGAFGLTGGYNWQVRSAVLGLEADGSLIASTDKKTMGWSEGYYAASKWKSLVTVRARAGVVVDNALVYVTGGAAFAKIDNRAMYDAACGDTSNYSGCSDKWATGLAVGAGVEYKLTSNLSVKGEYLYVAMQSTNVGNPGDSYQYGFDNSAHIARLGLNYSFGGPAPVVAKY